MLTSRTRQFGCDPHGPEREVGAQVNTMKKHSGLAGLTALALVAVAGSALADGMAKAKGSVKDAPVEAPKSDLQITGNFAATTDYVFRGISQSAENWTVQAGVDLTYKWFYAGMWGSGIDFGNDFLGRDIAHTEIDFYAGIKPVVGKFTFDLGVIYYTYPRARDPLAELNYVELKAGVSVEAWKDATLSFTAFYSPEYTSETGEVLTLEGGFAQVLPKFGPVTPTFSALLGYQTGDTAAYRAIIANGSDDYFYWNAGVALGFGDRFSIDLRYWDTNISDAGNFCSGAILQCDERFVATAKVTY
jgi:uncharacterized protein (TIGR02001 family)